MLNSWHIIKKLITRFFSYRDSMENACIKKLEIVNDTHGYAVYSKDVVSVGGTIFTHNPYLLPMIRHTLLIKII